MVLIPSGTKTSKVFSQKPTNGDGDFDFTRSTAATRVNADGNIEKETQNLLTHSGDLTNANWSIINSATYNGTETDPNGGNKAYSFTGGSTNSAVRQTNALSGGVYTFSVYLKSPTSAPINIRLDSNNGTFENYPCGLTTEWQRFEFFYVHNSASLSAWIGGGLSWTTGEEVHIAFPQLEQGLVARDYIETTTTALYGGITDNVPRLDYTDSSCPALLLEPQRTNLFPNSEYFSSWQVFRGSLTANSISSPEGVVNAYRYEENADTGQHFVRFQSISMTSGTDYTASVFVKAGEKTSVSIGSNAPSLWNPSTSTFNLSTGAVTSGGGTIEPMGNDWYRCIISGECVTTTSSGGLEITTSSGAGSTGDGLYIYGAQLEAGNYPTSYIPTYGTSVTRNDDSYNNTTGISYLLGSTTGTFFVDMERFNTEDRDAAGGTFELRSSNGQTEFNIDIEASGSTRAFYRDGGAFNFIYQSTALRCKFCFVYNGANLKLYHNGVKQFDSNVLSLQDFSQLIYTGV